MVLLLNTNQRSFRLSDAVFSRPWSGALIILFLLSLSACSDEDVKSDLPPLVESGAPSQKGLAESFNARLQDELLDREFFGLSVVACRLPMLSAS